MSARIDHAAEALLCGQRAEQATEDMQALTHLVSAQAHATMALAEQQRIANLIALSELTFPDGSRVYSFAVVEPGEHVDSYQLRAEVREGLGL